MKQDTTGGSYPLFSVTGVEVEYMIVDRQSLEIMPIADSLLETMAGVPVDDVERGPVTWSNELVLHVIELKTTAPAADLSQTHRQFHEEIIFANGCLEEFDAMLLPSAMHPWMNPAKQTRLWPHGSSEIYRKLNEIFDCRGHGWSNLQSVHLNFPFANEREFGTLHAAIRALLPLMPGLAASSPYVEMGLSGWMDSRLHFYRKNSIRIPSVTGAVIPEAVFTYSGYYQKILDRISKDIEPFDPANILKPEWMNARGAIARFDRGSIEVRVLDSQECCRADLAIAWLISSVLKLLVNEEFSSLKQLEALPLYTLTQVFLDAINDGGAAAVGDRNYCAALGLKERGDINITEIWQAFLEAVPVGDDEQELYLAARQLLAAGTLAHRLRKAIARPVAAKVREVYAELAQCLAGDRLFLP